MGVGAGGGVWVEWCSRLGQASRPGATTLKVGAEHCGASKVAGALAVGSVPSPICLHLSLQGGAPLTSPRCRWAGRCRGCRPPGSTSCPDRTYVSCLQTPRGAGGEPLLRAARRCGARAPRGAGAPAAAQPSLPCSPAGHTHRPCSSSSGRARSHRACPAVRQREAPPEGSVRQDPPARLPVAAPQRVLAAAAGAAAAAGSRPAASNAHAARALHGSLPPPVHLMLPWLEVQCWPLGQEWV